MKNLIILCVFIFSVLPLFGQQQFNTSFSDVASLSRNEDFRSKVGVAMYIRAGQALVDTTQSQTLEKYYEKMFASLIVTEGDNKYFVSLFTNAVLTQGANNETPDNLLYAYVNALWPEVVKAWMFRNGYIKIPDQGGN